ncbi:SIMPL domain-containing protein [Nocardioides zeicaulis]|uniref:SIMPL domain-containing protein n=1 Tax=Nocardioides zeicaulis TaxID=1776857 RepID=A0ABV6DX69_9ACTN
MRTVTVTGTGTSHVVPDTAVVRVAAVCRGAGVSEAYDAMVAAATTLVEVAGRHADGRRVASTGITVWPFHDHEGRREGYEARHGYAIACPDLASAGAMLAALAREVGDALAVDGLGLEATDGAVAGGRAREAAFHDARERAAALARMSGAGLGAVQSVVEGDGDGRPVPLAKVALASTGGIEAGESTVTSVVTVVWELL